MLAVKTYDQAYIDECRRKIDEQLAAYTALAAAAGKGPAGRAAVETFEPLFLNDLILVLDNYFVHRTRAIEGKDGNPLNEVRILCNGILLHDGVLAVDKTIKYMPEGAVLGLAIGGRIHLDEPQFRRLAKAYFAEIEARFT